MGNNSNLGEWGRWTCPRCDSKQDDPDSITLTCCNNHHVCLLGPTDDDGEREAWLEADDIIPLIGEHV